MHFYQLGRYDLAEEFGNLFRRSREKAGKSQDFMAKSIGKSKKTIQKWEAGESAPDIKTGFEWFSYLKIQPWPYFLKVLYPGLDEVKLDDDQELEDVLVQFIKDCPPDIQRKIWYCIKGDHGSSPIAILDMVIAHLHTPLRDRVAVSSIIVTNYEIAERSGTLVKNDFDALPNMNLLQVATDRGKEATIAGDSAYSAIDIRK